MTKDWKDTSHLDKQVWFGYGALAGFWFAIAVVLVLKYT